MKKILFILLIIFFIGSITAVSANATDDVIGSDLDDSIDLSSANDETPLPSNQNDDLLADTPDDVYNQPEYQQPGSPEQQQVPGCSGGQTNEKNFVVVEKHWEGNYSGSIEEIEIQLLKKLNPNTDHPTVPEPCHPKVPEPCPSPVVPGPAQQKTKQKASYDDINLDVLSDSIGDIIILPDENGELTSYVIVQTVKITKASNWKYVFKNITFTSASQNSTGHWSLGDAGEYIIREINLSNNTQLLSTNFVKYFTCPVDGGLKVFWNLTNRFIENKTNETPENNETPEIKNETNTTEQFNETPIYDDYGKGPDSPDETPEKSSQKTNDEKAEKNVSKNVDVSKATGNPLLVLLIVLSVLIAPVLRKR